MRTGRSPRFRNLRGNPAFGIALALWLLLRGTLAAAEPADPIVEEARSQGTFVLAEFVSKTCPACEEMRPVMEALFENHPEVRHQIHDADLEVLLAKKYEVRCVPVYVVVDPQGEVRFNDVGMRTLEELEQILEDAGAR